MTTTRPARSGLAHSNGSIAAGKQADLCAWRIESLSELGYWVGLPGPERRIFGIECRSSAGCESASSWVAPLEPLERPNMTDQQRRDNSRHIRARRGSEIEAKHWTTEAAVRMLMNNLDDEVAEDPQNLVVYGGIGRAARNWECYDKIVETLERLEEDQTLLVQSGKPVGVFRTHKDAPRVLHRQFEPRAEVGELGGLQRARSQGAHDVRPDDGRAAGSTSAARASSKAPTRPSPRWAASISAATSRAAGS